MSSDQNFKSLLNASLKSFDTEEKIDIIFFRPLGLRLALLAERIGITPNAITIFSIFSGVLAGHLFYYNSIFVNMIGIALLIFSGVMDSADGQLARMTGSCSRIGRVLDGVAGYLWFVSIYFHLFLRFVPACGSPLFYTLFGAGILSHSLQSAMADYYRNAHLFFVFGKGEFDNLINLKQQYEDRKGNMPFMEKICALFYIHYTQEQEFLTKNLQNLKKNYADKFNGVLPDHLKSEYRAMSLPLQKYCNGLTLNFRFYMIYLTLFLGNIYILLIFEAIFQNIILLQLIYRHESGCKRLNHLIQNSIIP